MKFLKPIITLLVVGGIAAGAYVIVKMTPQSDVAEAGRGRKGGAGPVSVAAEAARKADVPVYLEGVGTAKARNTITVKPQVDGRLLSLHFKEGQDIAKGDLLAKIDPVTYQAQLDQATAKKALDQAILANTQRDLARYEKVGTLAVSQQQIDTQKALILQQEAQIKSDDAAIENLTAILGYTEIKSPIAGRVGIRLVDEGNLLRAGDASGIVVITEIKPISTVFTLPQQQLPVLTKAFGGTPLVAEAFTTDSHALLDSGTLQVIDNQVDPQTGTVRLKAEFPNDTLQLWPGQFVNVRLLVDTLKDVVVVPAAAVQRGPKGPFVFVVTGDTVAMRPVKVAQQNEKDAVVQEGLNAGDMVVTSGFGRLEDGAKVKVSDGRSPSAPLAVSGDLPKPQALGTTENADAASLSVTTPAQAASETPAADPNAEVRKEGRRKRQNGGTAQ